MNVHRPYVVTENLSGLCVKMPNHLLSNRVLDDKIGFGRMATIYCRAPYRAGDFRHNLSLASLSPTRRELPPAQQQPSCAAITRCSTRQSICGA